MALRLRCSTHRRNQKTYRYYQLVRAVRRDGKPTHEVVAHLGRLPDDEVNALRRGLSTLQSDPVAESDGDAAEPLVRLRDICCLNSLRYLDLAVVHAFWHQWGFERFFSERWPAGARDVSPSDVLFVLAANRCVAPCSKLRVTEWVPRTALPELLGFQPSQLNNTRLHRVLKLLDNIEPALSQFIVSHPARLERADSVVFLDLTSTWFEGHGGSLGQRSRTKEGAIRRHVIHLALAVDAHGLPLLWEVLPGKTAEVTVVPHWLEMLAKHRELDGLPLVFDRGLTSEANLGMMVKMKRQFVTCARETQVDRWELGVDLDVLAKLSPGKSPSHRMLTRAGLHATDDQDIFHVDLGVRTPFGMDKLIDGLRVVPYFRPSLFVRNRESLERVCQNVEGKVLAINEDMRNAKRARSEDALRKKVEQLLAHFGVADEFEVSYQPHSVGSKSAPIKSYQVHLSRVERATSRKLNAGWMLLLAHPEDTRSPLELIRQYHDKEVVEHDFGVIKSVVELRPIHHQTDQKIRAHVTICILALLLSRAIELRLRAAGVKDAVDRVFEALEPCRLQALVDQSRRPPHYTIAEASPRQRDLLKALGLQHLADQEQTHRMQVPLRTQAGSA